VQASHPAWQMGRDPAGTAGPTPIEGSRSCAGSRLSPPSPHWLRACPSWSPRRLQPGTAAAARAPGLPRAPTFMARQICRPGQAVGRLARLLRSAGRPQLGPPRCQGQPLHRHRPHHSVPLFRPAHERLCRALRPRPLRLLHLPARPHRRRHLRPAGFLLFPVSRRLGRGEAEDPTRSSLTGVGAAPGLRRVDPNRRLAPYVAPDDSRRALGYCQAHAAHRRPDLPHRGACHF
jgi:hypothetical protein